MGFGIKDFMNQTIINRYKINFYNKVIDFSNGSRNEKIPDTNHVVSSFLFGWSSDDIDNYLIPNINSVINGTVDEFETGSEIIQAIVAPTVTTFYSSSQDHDFPVMPTADFKEILLGWREFLMQPPLSGA